MELKFILESLLFSAQKALTPKELRDLLSAAADRSEDPAVKSLKKTKEDEIVAALDQLAKDHDDAKRSYRLVCVAGAWQFASQPEFSPWIKVLTGEKARPARLSQPALETLAIVAYRQPLTRAEIEQIRGVAVDGVMQTLVERGLVEQVGRADAPGRPGTYGTTLAFLEYFGLRSLEDMPAADELRRIPLKKPETLVTADSANAPAPSEELPLAVVEGEAPAAPAADSATPPAPPAGDTPTSTAS
jgi:segregation and condensation protein B